MVEFLKDSKVEGTISQSRIFKDTEGLVVTIDLIQVFKIFIP